MPETQYINQWGNPAQQQQQNTAAITGLSVTIFDGIRQPVTYLLSNFQKPMITFGRAPGNDILLYSPIVSSLHGRFIFQNGRWYIEDRAVFGGTPSKNGLIYNNSYLDSRIISEGDFVRIDDGVQTIADGVLFMFSSSDQQKGWNMMPLQTLSEITIGRDPNCTITFPHISVSRLHARIIRTAEGFSIYDSSTNGVVVNNQRIRGSAKLNEKDVIVISNNKMIFTSNLLFFVSFNSGISVDAENILISRGSGKNAFATPHAMDINIRPGELIAIVGCSGAGKSTIMNCMSGYLQPTQGTVSINGTNLYENFDSLKEIIGYVPQADIVYDNLSVFDMLYYTAQMRLPKELTDTERKAAVERAIQMVDLQEHQQRLIKKLSGGQKKRASIAVELLSDPSLLFLDEPASGLDPGTEKMLMVSLRKMADGGKTVILVTHSVLQLQMCDRILFMGKGGRLCFFGSYEESLKFFGISDIVDVYNLLANDPENCWARFNAQQNSIRARVATTGNAVIRKRQKKSQIPVLFSRYLKLLFNDRQRAAIMFAQAPLLAFLISLVKNGDQFTPMGAGNTKSLLFALACAAFWIGMYNSIQEVCKERNIVKREFMAGLSLNSYLISKLYALAFVCSIQSFLLTTVFCLFVGTPEGVSMPAGLEMFITAFLSALAASAIGLLVSTLFTNPDRALTMAPLLLLPQILFSGLIFDVSGVTEFISWFVVCRWSMEGFGSCANLNELARMHTIDKSYEATSGHMMLVWFILILFVAGSLVLAQRALSSLAKDKS